MVFMTKRKKATPTFGEQIAQQILENYDITIILKMPRTYRMP